MTNKIVPFYVKCKDLSDEQMIKLHRLAVKHFNEWEYPDFEGHGEARSYDHCKWKFYGIDDDNGTMFIDDAAGYHDLVEYKSYDEAILMLTGEDEVQEKKIIVTTPSPNVKYVEVEVNSLFDLQDDFKAGNLYKKLVGTEKYSKITTENQLMGTITGGRSIYRAEEMKWQDEVRSCLETIPSSSYDVREILEEHDEEFLEMCRVALRATGELK